MKCKYCKFKTEMYYNKDNECWICPDCGTEDYEEKQEDEE